MTATQGNLASLSRYIFSTPRWYTSLSFAVAVGAVAGVAAFETSYLLEDAWQGIFFIAIPTIAASGLTSVVDRWLGGRLSPNRSSLLALACELVVVAVLLVAGVVAVSFPLPDLVAGLSPAPGLTGTDLAQNFVFDALLVALAGIFALRLLVITSVSDYSAPVAAVPASIQTVVAALFLFVYSGTIRFLELGGPLLRAYLARHDETEAVIAVAPNDFVLLAVLCVVYGVATIAFVKVIDRPWQRSMGVSVLDFVRGFVGHIAEGTRELESFFEQLGEDAVVPVTVMGVRGADGTEKARFVLPMIHPGPMGEIGGGNLPERVARTADGLAFPPHATAGHDFNLVTEREVDTLIEAADRAHDRIEYDAGATPPVRVREGESKLLGQAFGGDALAVATHAPGCADDVDFSVGLSTAAEARTAGLRNVMLVDAHNCNNGLEGTDLGHVVPGSRRSFDMIQGAERVGARLAELDGRQFRLGVAWDATPWDPIDGIGPLGVRVAVVEVGDQRTGYVLVDGNNMEPGLREEILAALDHLDVGEVMTTDTHIVNTVEATNQVGSGIPHDELIDLIRDLADDAVDDLEPVEAGMATRRAEVTVFGNDRTETLASHANAMVSMGSALAAAFILAVSAVSLLIFFVTS